MKRIGVCLHIDRTFFLLSCFFFYLALIFKASVCLYQMAIKRKCMLSVTFVSVFAEAGRSGGGRRVAALRAVWFLHSQQHFFSAALAFFKPPERGGAAPNPANPERSAGRGGARCHLYNTKKPCSRKWYDTKCFNVHIVNALRLNTRVLVQ